MQNTIKPPTVAWALAALVFFPFIIPTAGNLPMFALRLVGAALLAYFAYKSYRKGAVADASTGEPSPQSRSPWRLAGIAAAVVIAGIVAVVSFGPKIQSLSTTLKPAGVEGRYRDPSGNTVEFLKDGTAVFIINGRQAVWKWSVYDGGKLKLEPGPGLIGVTAAMCDYQTGNTALRVTGCIYAMQLTRL